MQLCIHSSLKEKVNAAVIFTFDPYKMCLFVYTLSSCSHSCFQNVAECAVAQGFSGDDNDDNNKNTLRMDMTLATPKFLFDTARSHSRTPDFYRAAFNCKKRKATRPVTGLCKQCLRNAAEQHSLKTKMNMGSVAIITPSDGGDAGVLRYGQPFDSRAALVGLPHSSSVSSTSTSDTTSSTKSVAWSLRSFWKRARPSEMV
ncbi:hypothetical protein BD289DRAFT_107671 [Coniella lustricola]|uniref:Uncharacterized protein n=1 Tax=Coniella lustricola TaxID=2025994 RepID=A0A2T3AGJ4_9PEZI|nr:hypothetical protein BD289DRAFT_107671 [Coniella lustricola]